MPNPDRTPDCTLSHYFFCLDVIVCLRQMEVSENSRHSFTTYVLFYYGVS